MHKKIIFISVVAGILVLGALLNSKDSLVSFGKKDTTWYAVHLSNNQIYFGHIASVTDSTIVLADTYFVESYQEAPPAAALSKNFALEQAPQQSFRLVRRGDEKVLSSDHTFFINRATVLYWEKLMPESEVVVLLKSETE